MNPLQKHAHLFANGEFKFMYADCACELVAFDICEGPPFLLYDGVEKFWGSRNNATLIARPIEDVTDDEMVDLPHLDSSASKETINWYRDSLKDRRGVGIAHKDFLHLLSIGVYPFDQSHFDDGIVIDSREVMK